ncbi:hypothetical protein [Prochlorococcus sp. MIT 1300]|nr:hypothetical protein [Prochlorococcus sp. MIT 1300]
MTANAMLYKEQLLRYHLIATEPKTINKLLKTANIILTQLPL